MDDRWEVYLDMLQVSYPVGMSDVDISMHPDCEVSLVEVKQGEEAAFLLGALK
jgi:hypothetical protein